MEDIEFQPKAGINVLVGPNAVGKTSVLEAIRLTKALLAPRYRDETPQVLQSLGASTPHMMFGEQQIDFSAIAGNSSKPLELTVEFSLSEREISVLEANELQLSQAIVRSKIGQERQSQLDLIQYMSSPLGQEQQCLAAQEFKQYIINLRSTYQISLGLIIKLAGNSLQINSKDTLAQLIVGSG